MIQVIGQETTVALDQLMDQMEKCYSHQEGQFYRMPLHLIHVGQICATIYHGDKNWNRAIVTKEPECGFVEVLYVDYGDVASVSVHSIFLLKTSFQVLPAQMIRARLSHLQPADMQSWHPHSRRIMLEMCRDKSLVALVTDVDDCGILSLLVCDTRQSDTVDIYVNDVLIEKGMAIYVDDSLSLEEREAIKDALHHKQEAPELGHQAVTEQANTVVASSTSGVTSHHSDEPPPYELHDPGANPPTEQNRTKEHADEPFVEVHQFSESLTFHVVNYEGNLLMTSAEISAIFRPDSTDLLLPMLLMKRLNFQELLLKNDHTHSRLFTELEKHRVKGAVENGILRQFVTFYQVCDVPSMIVDIGYPEKTDLLDFFNLILNKSNNKNTNKVSETVPPFNKTATADDACTSSSPRSPNSLNSKPKVHTSTTNSHFADSESSSPNRKMSSHTTDDSPLSKNIGITPEEGSKKKAVVDKIEEFKFLIKDMSPDILKALQHQMTGKRETMLNQLATAPSKDLVTELENVFLQIKLVEQVLQQTENGKTVGKFNAEPDDKIEPPSVNRFPSVPARPSTSHRVYDVYDGDVSLEIIPPVPPQTMSNIFASMSLSRNTSTLTASSPPFKPTSSLVNNFRPVIHPTVTVAPMMAPQNPRPIPSPWCCVNSVGYTPRPMMGPNPMEVMLPQHTPMAPRPMNPFSLYRQGIWVPTHFPPNNVS
uniref:Tudor domain-containing protein 5-like n=1 Tax=Phallusia mammillata TaxID=59560 RepID=A0A6F9DTX0_9ASCI|nr:tudor domain-containing protein 5-like [Phallusia mammillata]